MKLLTRANMHLVMHFTLFCLILHRSIQSQMAESITHLKWYINYLVKLSVSYIQAKYPNINFHWAWQIAITYHVKYYKHILTNTLKNTTTTFHYDNENKQNVDEFATNMWKSSEVFIGLFLFDIYLSIRTLQYV